MVRVWPGNQKGDTIGLAMVLKAARHRLELIDLNWIETLSVSGSLILSLSKELMGIQVVDVTQSFYKPS